MIVEKNSVMMGEVSGAGLWWELPVGAGRGLEQDRGLGSGVDWGVVGPTCSDFDDDEDHSFYRDDEEPEDDNFDSGFLDDEEDVDKEPAKDEEDEEL